MHFLTCLAAATLVSAKAFSISVFSPNTDVNGAVLHAYDYGFATQLDSPAIYCPLKPEAGCPKVADTLVSMNMESMAVQVPGGQQIYIGADGQVRYATANSHALPPEAIVGGWFHKGIESACLGPLAHDLADFTDGRGNGGLVLCPVDWTIKGLTLYAKMKGFKEKRCADIVGLQMTSSNSSVGCWQYS